MAFKCGKGFMSSAAKAQKGDGERKQEWHEAICSACFNTELAKTGWQIQDDGQNHSTL